MAVSAPDFDGVMDSCRHLIEIGAALHWLVPKQKNPLANDWSTLPRSNEAELRASYKTNANIGIRLGEPSKTDLGYIYLIDLDIRDPLLAAEAWNVLLKMWPEARSFPTVISGSGGESRHIYFISPVLLRKANIAKSDTFKMVFDKRINRDVKKRDWEIDLYGTGSQAVLPPSVHPDTGNPYIWERPFDTSMLDLGIAPTITEDVVGLLGRGSVSVDEDRDDDTDEDDYLLNEVRNDTLDLSQDDIVTAITDLPEEWVEDRDTWVTVGAALHHQFGGNATGFEIWCDWAKQSDKYEEKTQKSVWKSFKGSNHRPVTMRTVIQASNEARLQRNLPVIVEQDDDLADLLGDTDTTEIGPVKPQIDPNWTSYLDRNEDGHPKGVLHNVTLIVKNDIRTHGIVALNEFTQEVVLLNEPKTVQKSRESAKPVVNLTSPIWKVTDPVNGQNWTDSHDQGLRAMIEAPKGQGGYGVKVSDRDLKGAIDLSANGLRFHPVREYLKSLKWDGVRRAERLFTDYLGAEDTPYHREAATLFLIGAVVRVFEPGHKFDFVPILEGIQGKRKSTFIRILGRDWFSELSGDFSNVAAMVEQIQGSWIVEIPELQGFSRADTNVLKAWISRQFDKARLAYDRRARVFPRQCVFVGSTNDEEYLRDHTGGRRFWPISCGLLEDEPIDTERLESEVDMIWAEAVHLYREMRATCKLKELPLYIQSDEARAEASALQESRRVETVEDALSGRIEAWLDEPIGTDPDFDDLDPDAPKVLRNFTCVMQIWEDMMGNEAGRLGTAEATKIGKALGRIKGWQKYSKNQLHTRKYGKQRIFKRVSVDPEMWINQSEI